MFFQATVDIRQEIVSNNDLNYPNITGDALGTIVSSVVGVAIIIAGLATLIYFIWGGYNWLTAGGDKAQVEAARSRITNALIGLTIVASSFAIYKLVDSFFGIGNVGSSSACSDGWAQDPETGKCLPLP